MSGALLCAALLHIALFLALDRFAHFPDTSPSSNDVKTTRIHLSLAQTKPEPETQSAEAHSSSRGEDKIETSRSQLKDQIKQSTPRPEADENKPEQKSPVTVKKTITSSSVPAPPLFKLPIEQVERKTGTKSGTQTTAQSTAETGATDTSRFSHLQSTENNPQSSNRKIEAQQGSSDRSRTQQHEFTVYLQQLIEEKRRYPRAARQRNIEGSVEFSVHVSREGSLAELTLRSSSGSRILDKAAEDLLEKVFPVDYPLQENVQTTIRIIYKLTEV